jgi:hypothetical protein
MEAVFEIQVEDLHSVCYENAAGRVGCIGELRYKNK